ncbi:hypothetical protein [Rhizobium sp. BK176]|uniref:hypothetical protein n=1 Tax=Rhizobium sp. BK176 TaxID=2587071 RepID=UPI0021686A77|nr:hypothetical protein [Rhizobium sp. BK176]MCS4089218.1 hypothetical protein [Rhizobium sp. BK176]
MPYFYYVHQLVGGETKKRAMVGYVDRDVPVVDKADVDILATWSIFLGEDFGDHAELLRCQCVRWRGSVYAPVMDEVTGRLLALSDFEGKVSDAYKSPHRSIFRGLVKSENALQLLHAYSNGRAFNLAKNSIISSSTEPECLAEMEAVADTLIVMEGHVFQKASRLHLRVIDRSNPKPLDIVEVWPDFSKDDGQSWFRFDLDAEFNDSSIFRFSLDDADHSEDLTETYQDGVVHDVKVFDSTALAFNGRSDYLARMINRFLLDTASDVGEYPKETVAQWVDVRDSVAKYHAGLTPSVDEAVINTFLSWDSPALSPQRRALIAHARIALERYATVDLKRNASLRLGS